MDKIFPEKINNYLQLIRINKPIGFMLLLWPCWFSLAYLDLPQRSLLSYYILFFVGAIIMRSAGCIINDLIDQDIDIKVERTASRPIASKKISNFNALVFLIVLLIIGLVILLQFKLLAIITGLLCTPLIVLYPFMKRLTFWPQLFLGIIFNFGVIICSVEFYGKLTIEYLILYISCVLWTIGYDTIYAYQDIKDDKINNIKSTAVLFGNYGKSLVIISYTLMLTLIAYLTLNKSPIMLSSSVFLVIFIYIIMNLLRWNQKSTNSSGKKFRQNNLFGAIIFIYLLSF